MHKQEVQLLITSMFGVHMHSDRMLITYYTMGRPIIGLADIKYLYGYCYRSFSKLICRLKKYIYLKEVFVRALVILNFDIHLNF